jgi:hypothetical protein
MNLQKKIRQGEILFGGGKIEESEKYFSSLLENDSTNAEILNNLGVIYHTQENIDRAEDFFLKTLAIKEDYLDASLNLASLYQNTKRWEEAAIQLEKCISMAPMDIELKKCLAMVYLEMGENQKARQVMLKSQEVNHGQDIGTESIREQRGMENASSVSVSLSKSNTITMKKSALIEALKNICYFPHPEAHKGQLVLSKEIFEDDDRETNVSISPWARIDLTGDIFIGPWTMIGTGTRILTHDHLHEGRDKPLLMLQEERGIKWKSKIVGRDVWLHGCTILGQVSEIPDGVVVGNGSVLTKNPGPYEIWAGNPAKKVGER